MATADESRFEQLLSRIEHREATARRRIVLLSLIPVVVAIVVLGGLALGVRTLAERASAHRADAEVARQQAEQARQDVEQARREAAAHAAKAEELQQRVAELEAQLRQTTDVMRFRHEIDLTDVKMIASRFPRSAQALELILRLRDRRVGWRLGGRSPAQGFDSPGFAAYVLQQVRPGLVPALAPGNDLVAVSRRLMDLLPRVATPSVGDLVFYPSGYALFRFEDRQRQPFVVGMTPLGIVALKPDFSQVVGAARVAW